MSRDRLRDARGNTPSAARAPHDDEDLPGLPGRVQTGGDEAPRRRAATQQARSGERGQPRQACAQQEVQAYREGS